MTSTSTPAQLAAPAASQPPEVLLEDTELRVELHHATSSARVLVVTFDPIAWPLAGPAYGVDFLTRSGCDVVAWRKKQEHFFQGLTRERFQAVMAPLLPRYERRLAYGSSLGAYAVLYFCRDGFERVVASSPRVSAHPRWGSAHWQRRVRFRHLEQSTGPGPSGDAVIFYDPHDAQDRHYVDEALRPAFPRARFIAIPYAGHPANQFLGEIGFIAPYMRAVVAAGTEPMPDRRLKAKSSMYHQVLAEACLAHRKPRWALALATRSLELNPRMELAYRTLGEAELALGRIDEAETHLRRFAERSPLDGVAHQALHKVAAARAERAASAALLRGSGPPLWRRAIARAVGPLWRKR